MLDALLYGLLFLSVLAVVPAIFLPRYRQIVGKYFGLFLLPMLAVSALIIVQRFVFGEVHKSLAFIVFILCILAIAYRYYSAFLAARVAALDDSRITPAHVYNDGQNFHPTNKWVLFGHHFAAISGAGPLIGPVLAIQYGFFPGMLWLVIGVCLAGAVQDMLVLAASVRRGGRSLAEIARSELGKPAAVIVSAAILFIVVIALAGLGLVVVKALGGEEVKLAKGTAITLPEKAVLPKDAAKSSSEHTVYAFPEKCIMRFTPTDSPMERPEAFHIGVPVGEPELTPDQDRTVTLPEKCIQLVPGSSWGTFTIACTVPIALFVGLYMYRIRKGKVVEASLIGAAAVLAATVAGNWIQTSPLLASWFSLTKTQTVLALTGYGFIASVLPVWLLLCPRDYLSSFLKIGTIALLVVGVIIANPVLQAPAVNQVFRHGGPTFPWGGIFPFVFICIMCGSISGFHALVSSGTTPKMIEKESQVRMIGYGAMLMEGLVGIVALIAAASMPVQTYFDINIDLSSPKYSQYQKDVKTLTGSGDLTHLPVESRRDLAEVERDVGGESLRGRVGGAVTLAVGMSDVLVDAFRWTGVALDSMRKYWYHFAIMFEALFILTTIDTGTRIARFLLQETMGVVHPQLGKTDWLPGAVLATGIVTFGWGALVWSGSIDTIWPMFGIANQLLAVIALCLVTTMLVNSGRSRFALVTLLPMTFVTATTMSAGADMIPQFANLTRAGVWSTPKGVLNIGLMVFVMTCVGALLFIAAINWVNLLLRPRLIPADAPQLKKT
jgi:carbon starvation protein